MSVVQAVTLQALEAVSARLRDKKLPVRKEAALQLAAVFRCVKPTIFALWAILDGQAIYALCAVPCNDSAERRLMLSQVPDKCPPHDAIMLNHAIIGFKQFGSHDLGSSMVTQYAQQVRCSLCCSIAAYLLSTLPDHTASNITAAKLLEPYDSLTEHDCIM